MDKTVAKEREAGEEDISKKAPFQFFSLVMLVVLSRIYTSMSMQKSERQFTATE